MYFNELHIILHEACSLQIEGSINKIVKILKYNNSFFYVEFVVAQILGTFSSEVVDGSHEKHLAYLFNQKVEQIMQGHLTSAKLEINYNFTENQTRKIIIFFNAFIKENEFLFPNEVQQQKLAEKQKKYEIENEFIENVKNKRKLLNVVLNSPGINLTDLIKKTRSIKDPEKRKKYLKEMIDEKKIEMSIDESRGRKKRIYKAL